MRATQAPFVRFSPLSPPPPPSNPLDSICIYRRRGRGSSNYHRITDFCFFLGGGSLRPPKQEHGTTKRPHPVCTSGTTWEGNSMLLWRLQKTLKLHFFSGFRCFFVLVWGVDFEALGFKTSRPGGFRLQCSFCLWSQGPVPIGRVVRLQAVKSLGFKVQLTLNPTPKP